MINGISSKEQYENNCDYSERRKGKGWNIYFKHYSSEIGNPGRESSIQDYKANKSPYYLNANRLPGYITMKLSIKNQG